MAIVTGVLLGLSTLAFIGPVLFYLIKSSMESGTKAGVAVAFGIIIGDAIYVVLAFYGVKKYFNEPEYQKWIALAGGIILLIIGLKYAIKPNTETNIEEKIKKKSLGIYFMNGFLINFVNPFVFAVWLGFITYNQTMYDDYWSVVSVITTLVVIFSTDILKVIFAQRLLKLIHPKILRQVFRIFGLVMILFGARLLWASVTLSL